MSERGQKLARYVDELGRLRTENDWLRKQLAASSAEHLATIAGLVGADSTDAAGVVCHVRDMRHRNITLTGRVADLEKRIVSARLELDGAHHARTPASDDV